MIMMTIEKLKKLTVKEAKDLSASEIVGSVSLIEKHHLSREDVNDGVALMIAISKERSLAGYVYQGHSNFTRMLDKNNLKYEDYGAQCKKCARYNDENLTVMQGKLVNEIDCKMEVEGYFLPCKPVKDKLYHSNLNRYDISLFQTELLCDVQKCPLFQPKDAE